MASVTKRETTSGPRYDVRYRTPDRHPRKKTFRRKVDAERYAREVETDMARGDWIDETRGRITFGEWWEDYRSTVVDLRPSTLARDASYYRSLIAPTFADMALSSIDHAAVTAWVASIVDAGKAPATVVKAKQIVSKALGAAVDNGLIRSNPAERVKVPRIEHVEMQFLTPAEVVTLAEAIDSRYRALVYLGAYCGLRIGELGGLRRERVDLLHGRVEVLEAVTEVRGHLEVGPLKTSRSRRSVPIPKVVAAELEDHLARLDDVYVFGAPEGGPLRVSLFRRRAWNPATAAAGMEGLRLHDLRHTAVAFWIAAGASPKAIAARAGHASVVTVLDRYGHLLPGHEDEVNERLDAMAEAARPAPDAEVFRIGDA